jgi:23S rRNA pseudouridine2605 synthase
MFLQDGRTAPAKVKTVRKEEMNSWVEITIHEGRKRQVRRMFDHVGSSVIRLKRIRTGSLVLGDLPEGSFRHLTLDEVNALRDTASKTDDSGKQVRVYRPAIRIPRAEERSRDEGRPVLANTRVQAGTRDEGMRHVPRTRVTRVMQDTRGGLRKNQGLRARPGMHAQGLSSREGFSRETRVEGPRTRPAPRRPAPGAASRKPGFGSRGTGRAAGGERRWQPSGPRPNKSMYTGSKGGQARGARPGSKGRGQRTDSKGPSQGKRSGPGRGTRGTGNRGPRR